MVHFPNEILTNIISFIKPDEIKNRQILLKKILTDEINDIFEDYIIWDYEISNCDLIYFINWFRYTCPYEFDLVFNH